MQNNSELVQIPNDRFSGIPLLVTTLTYELSDDTPTSRCEARLAHTAAGSGAILYYRNSPELRRHVLKVAMATPRWGLYIRDVDASRILRFQRIALCLPPITELEGPSAGGGSNAIAICAVVEECQFAPTLLYLGGVHKAVPLNGVTDWTAKLSTVTTWLNVANWICDRARMRQKHKVNHEESNAASTVFSRSTLNDTVAS